MEHISECRSCSSKKIIPFFNLGNQPFANSLVKDKDTPNKIFPLSLSWCPECYLVQLNHTAPPQELFSKYVWVTGTSSTAIEYSYRFCDNVLDHMDKVGNKYILELASNDGTFLKPFIKKGYNVLGVDPAENIVETASKQGIPTICGFFGKTLAKEIISKYGIPKVVFARNVLPHVANLHDFIEGIGICMNMDTLLVIEVHYAKVILEELHYDSVYHEHLCYFTVKSIEHLLAMYGLYVFDIISSPISGGSIVLFISNKKTNESPSLQKVRYEEEKYKTNELSEWKIFADKAFSHKKILLQLLKNEIESLKSIVGYGASARSSTMLNFCNIDSRTLVAIADQNPLKHGFFTPGTHIKIESPDEVMKIKPDCIFILAWNFFNEIKQILKEKYSFNGRLIVPFPYPPKTIDMRRLM